MCLVVHAYMLNFLVRTTSSPCLTGMCSNDDDDVEQLTFHVISHTIAIMHGFIINICIIQSKLCNNNSIVYTKWQWWATYVASYLFCDVSCPEISNSYLLCCFGGKPVQNSRSTCLYRSQSRRLYGLWASKRGGCASVCCWCM